MKRSSLKRIERLEDGESECGACSSSRAVFYQDDGPPQRMDGSEAMVSVDGSCLECEAPPGKMYAGFHPSEV